MTPTIIKRNQAFRSNQKFFGMQTCELKKHTSHKFKKGEKIIVNDNVYYYWGASRKRVYFYDEKSFFDIKSQQKNREEKTRAANLESNFYLDYINNYKLTTGCQNPDCMSNVMAYNNPRLLHFDHIDPKNKEYNISDLTNPIKKSNVKETQEKYFALIKTEMDKCRVLCSFCHTLKTEEGNNGAEKTIEANTKDKSYYIDRPPVISFLIQK